MWETTNNKPPEPVKLSETLRSQNIFFDSDYWTLRATSRALKGMYFFRLRARSLPVNSLELTLVCHPRFPLQGSRWVAISSFPPICSFRFMCGVAKG
jgi:hypothetical protein